MTVLQVLQDLLLRGKGTSFGKEHEGVEVLRGALLSVSEGIRNSLYSVAFNDRSAALTDPTNAMSIGDHCADYAPMRDSDNLGFESGPIATGNGSESSSDWAVRVRECAEGYSAYYKSIGVGRGCNPRNEDAGSGSCDSLASPQSLFIVGDEDGEERRFSFTGSHSVPHALDWVVKCITVVSQSNIRKSSFNVGAECRSDIPTLYTSESIHGDRRGDRNRVNNQGDEGVADLICHPADEIYPSIAFTRAFFSLLSNLKVGVPLSLQSAPQTKTDSGIGLINVANAFIRASGGNLSTLSLLPPPIRVFVELALHQSKEAPFFPLEQGALSPALAWPSSVLVMIGRNDLCAHLTGPVHSSSSGSKGKPRGGSRGQSSTHSSAKVDDSVSLDGLTEIEEEASRLRFADDDRVHEVCRLLRSSCGVYLRLEKAPEVSDLDHRHKLQMRLLALCRRSLACPVGRGALALGSLTPLMAEALPCPPLSLFGRIPPNNTPLLLSTVTAPEDLSLWPEFHNGVAAGLRVSSPKDNVPNISSSSAGVPRSTGASTVTRNWIVYNRTATGDDSSFHAGVLLALGLQGHLRVLSVTDICDYLTQGNQPTTIALLVGLPASRLGTADPLLSKTLCLHVPSLLPPQHWDIEILPQVQTAALVGLGLLYSNSGHRLMTEFLLAELGRRPTTDRDRGDCREAVSFAAAWALGVVLLGKGKGNKETETTERIVGGLDGLTDLCIEDRLYQHLEGGKRPPDSNLFPYAGVPQGDGHAAGGRSSRVMEGDQLNTGVTGPGAAVALGLIYIRSGNEEICNRLTLPQTAFALESIRPDLLLYRAVARCLVLWEAIDPTDAWIDTQTPEAVTRSLFPSKIPVEGTKMYRRENRKVELDPRSALAVYLNVVTGHCWGIGLVFAGTANDKARDTLLGKLRMLQMFRDNKQPFPLSFTPNTKTLRPLVESCIGTVALALSCVMAGTGDLSCLRILRFLRWKVDDVTYGTHMALAMAIGLLFLSGGSASLRRDPMSCACLLLATAPRFPIRTVDNQYHLQALRHLYVLAVEARALQIIDADTGCAVSVDIEVVLVSGELLAKRAPCLLPELVTVRSVSLPSSSPTSSLYYPASMVVTSLEAGSQSHIPHPLFVKRRPSSSLPSREINLTHVTRDSLAAVESCNGFSPSIKRCQSASQSLMSSLKSRLAGGKQQSTVMRARTELGSLHVAGLLESHLGLDYLLLAASETLKERPWGIKNDSKPRGIEMTAEAAASPSRNDLVGGIDSRESFSGTSKHSRMNDISLALSAIGPLTHHIFLQAMSESIVAEK